MRLWVASARRVSAVPGRVAVLLGVALVLQVVWHVQRDGPRARADALTTPPRVEMMRVVALGDDVALARLLTLWLQAHDNQPGISIPFKELDYTRVTAWLGLILDLDPRTNYPLLAAARLYGTVPDPPRQRQMYEFVHERFLEAPDRRWPWLAHAALMAKHRLKDLPLALRYARAVTEQTRSTSVPAWALDMTAVILEDLGEREAAKIVLGGLLESGRVADPREVDFLKRKIEALEEPAQPPSGPE